jgi:hypothetical protein
MIAIKKRYMMKLSLRLGALLAFSIFCVGLSHAQSLKERFQGWLPKDPRTSLNLIDSRIPNTQASPFSLSSLQTPQAVSNAMKRLVQAFKLLSPRTLAQIIKTQKEKYEKNSVAFAENPTWTNRGAMVANVLAISAATAVLAGEAALIGYGIKQGVDAGKNPLRRHSMSGIKRGIS